MSEKLRELGRKVTDRLNSENEQIRRRWQAVVGVTFMFVFVVTSVVVNRAVFAANLAAGNYGYVSGTYGYNASTTSSDNLPSAPTALDHGTPGSSSATIGWTAPTTTTGSTAISTGGGSISSYKFHYSTSSLSACSGGTSSTETATSKTITGLNPATTYYVAICATDNNTNDSAALTGSFATAATGGGTGGGGSGSSIFTSPAPTVAAVPAATTGTVAVPAVPTSTAADGATLVAHLKTLGISLARSEAAEAAGAAKVSSSATEFRVTITAIVRTVAANFVSYGTSSVTVSLGSGERLAVIRDLFDTLGSVVQSDASKLLLVAEQISSGQKPTVRNLAKERAQVSVMLPAFQKLTGKKAPDFKNVKDDLAWNTMLYRVRFSRDLVKERAGIVKFKATFKKVPKTPADWAVVRAWAYALTK